MSPSICPSCGQRRGRRACPALGRSICALCCGSKRRSEIPCPPDCPYLASAEQHPPSVVQRRRERQGRFLVGVVEGLTQSQYQLFLFVQMAVAGHAPSVGGLLDRDVAAAAGALAATFETASRGIIYEHHAASIPAQRLTAELRGALDALGREGHPPRDADLAVVLRRTERAASDAGREFTGEQAYLGLLAEVFPDAAARLRAPRTRETGEGPAGLIIP